MRNWILALIMLCLSAPAMAAQLSVGDLAHDKAGRDVANNKIFLSEHKGKVVILTFWATWCAPCMKEMPILEAIQREVSKDQLTVIAINYKEDKGMFRQIKRRLKGSEITLSYDSYSSVAKKYEVKGIPYTLIIDKTGRIAHIHLGYGDDILGTLINELNVLLAP